MAEYADMKIAQGGATQRPALRDTYNQACWFLLNGGSRACIKDRGHDARIHEGPEPKQCAAHFLGSERGEPHVWTEKHLCEGVEA